MSHNFGQCRESTIVIEAALGVGRQPVQRRGPVRMIGGTIRLEVIYTDSEALCMVLAGFHENRVGMTGAAFRFATEQFAATICSNVGSVKGIIPQNYRRRDDCHCHAPVGAPRLCEFRPKDRLLRRYAG